jgi:hypothetical protein
LKRREGSALRIVALQDRLRSRIICAWIVHLLRVICAPGSSALGRLRSRVVCAPTGWALRFRDRLRFPGSSRLGSSHAPGSSAPDRLPLRDRLLRIVSLGSSPLRIVSAPGSFPFQDRLRSGIASALQDHLPLQDRLPSGFQARWIL